MNEIRELWHLLRTDRPTQIGALVLLALFVWLAVQEAR